MKNEHGFSLIELMIVVAIVGVLGFIVVPSYQGFVKDGKRSAAQSYMLELASRQANYLQDNRNYTSTVSELNVVASDEVTSNYSFTIVIGAAGEAPIYTITASPKSSGSMSSDGDLTINHLGVKTPASKW
ncbi:type IV pilin protein [Litoribacillus peritrichatus]